MRTMRRSLQAVLGAVLVAALLVLAHPVPANAADAGVEAQFVAKINNIRASQGLGPLAVYGEVRDVARGWTDQMVANGSISHNPDLAGQVSANWRKLGENVGVGNTVDSLMTAFVNSPAHYKNIIDPDYNYIGVGVSYDANGRMYTTHDFMALDDAPAPPSDPAPAPDPAPVAAPTPAPTPRSRPAAPAVDPASFGAAPQSDAPVDTPPPAMAPAMPTRLHTVLTALRVVGS